MRGHLCGPRTARFGAAPLGWGDAASAAWKSLEQTAGGLEPDLGDLPGHANGFADRVAASRLLLGRRRGGALARRGGARCRAERGACGGAAGGLGGLRAPGPRGLRRGGLLAGAGGRRALGARHRLRGGRVPATGSTALVAASAGTASAAGCRELLGLRRPPGKRTGARASAPTCAKKVAKSRNPDVTWPAVPRRARAAVVRHMSSAMTRCRRGYKDLLPGKYGQPRSLTHKNGGINNRVHVWKWGFASARSPGAKTDTEPECQSPSCRNSRR